MGTIVFAALLPVRSSAAAADAQILRGVSKHLSARLEQKKFGVLTPDAPATWSADELPVLARSLGTRYVLGVEIVRLDEENVTPAHAPGASFAMRAEARAHVWDASQQAWLVQDRRATSEANVGQPGPDARFKTDGRIRVAVEAAVSALSPLL